MATYRGLLSCVICFGGEDAAWASLECGHVFHEPCVAEWLRKPAAAAAQCPMCRKRSRSLRRLACVDSHLEAADNDAVAAHLREREAQLRDLMAQAEARQARCDERVAEAEAACGAALEHAEAARQAAQRAERALAKANGRLEAVTQQKEALATHLQETSDRGLLLQQELDTAQERHAAEVARLRAQLKEVGLRLGEARRRLVAYQLSNKGLTVEQAQNLLQGDDSNLAQVLVARNSELAAAERKLEAAQAAADAERQEAAGRLEAAERRHRAEMAQEAEERTKLRRRELQLEYERDIQARRAQELEAELADLHGVLLALEGAGRTAPSSALRRHAAAPVVMHPPSGSDVCGTNGLFAATGRTCLETHGPEPCQQLEVGGILHPGLAGGEGAEEAADAVAPAPAGSAANGGGGNGGAKALPPSRQPCPVSFLSPRWAPGCAEPPPFLGAGRKPALLSSSWTGQSDVSLGRQGPDGFGGHVRLLATSMSAPGAKRPIGAAAVLPSAVRPTKQRKQHADVGAGGAKQLKLSSFFSGRGVASTFSH